MCKRFLFVLLSFVLTCSLSLSFASEEDLSFTPSLEHLDLRGKARFKWFIFEVFNASFYTEHKVDSFEEIFDRAGDVFLELTYSRAIPAEDFISSSEKSLNQNKNLNRNAIEDHLNRLYSVYEDVEAGEKYALFYFASTESTCLFKNGVKKVCLGGKDFAKAYFGIWLSRYSVDDKFSRKLLGS
ncbi:MAG TPA: chalcone isomerase family protein [Oligoflexia bacterium]|nr:chalcone isomerase family protein [Oligoflexia bacterium]HMP48478.1 chalcone isomerase family protein [Oligoflexia bacterium]